MNSKQKLKQLRQFSIVRLWDCASLPHHVCVHTQCSPNVPVLCHLCHPSLQSRPGCGFRNGSIWFPCGVKVNTKQILTAVLWGPVETDPWLKKLKMPGTARAGFQMCVWGIWKMELRVLCRCSHPRLGFREESTNRQHQTAQKPLIPDPPRMREINTKL